MSLKDKVSFRDIKDLSTGEIQGKLKAREFGLSPDEAETFKKFATAAPGSETRIKILSDQQEAPPDIVPGSEEDVKPPVQPATNPELPPVVIDPDDPTATIVPDKHSVPAENEVETTDTPVVTIDKYASATQERDAHRRANSKLGKELSDVKAKLVETQKKLSEKAKAEPEIVPLEAPSPPSLDKYDEGAYDAEYINARTDYEKKYMEYAKKSGETPPAWANELVEKVTKLETKAEQAFNYTTSEQQAKADTIQNRGWNDMWKNTVEIQKKLNLPTGNLTPEQLNYHVIRAGNPVDGEGRSIYPANEVESANGFMKEVPEAVSANFDKLSKVVNSYYEFGGDVPQKKTDIADEFFLPAIVKKLGLNIKTLVPVPNSNHSVEALSEHQTKNFQSENATPATEHGAPTDSLSNSMSQDEKILKYNRMAKAYLNNPHSCKQNLQWMDEYNKLEREIRNLT